MTAAGVGSLLICQRQLAALPRQVRSDAPSKLLTPLDGRDGHAPRYDVDRDRRPGSTPAIKRGMAWLAANFTTANSADRRPVDLLRPLRHRADRGAGRPRDARPGRLVRAGPAVHHSTQQADGSWYATHGDEPEHRLGDPVPDRSTAKTLKRIEVKRLGAGTLLGGRGLPKDLSRMTVAGGRVVSRPMNGAVEGMLAVLEDPRTRTPTRRSRPGRALPDRGTRPCSGPTRTGSARC